MTQAFNLSQLANKVNTSGQLDVATGASGTLPISNGGTGTTSPSLVGGTNITISGSWPNQTVTAAGGGVTSLNGQTGAITNTDYNAIGSCVNMNCASAITVGNTTAGSNLRKINSAGSLSSAGLSGTWRNMGPTDQGNGYNNWTRIS